MFVNKVTDFAVFNAEEIALSIEDQAASVPPAVGLLKRSLSYKPKTEATICGFTPPFVKPKSLFPLIKIGRASRVFTRILAYELPS